MKLNLTEQQESELHDLRTTAALLAIKIDLLTAEYEAAKEREKAVYNAALTAKPFYYAEDFCDHNQGERITDADEIGAASNEQLKEFCALVTAKYAELYNLNYPLNYCPIYVEYRKPLIEAQREFRKIGVAFLRICEKSELADELEQALNGYLSPSNAERIDEITRQFCNSIKNNR